MQADADRYRAERDALRAKAQKLIVLTEWYLHEARSDYAAGQRDVALKVREILLGPLP